MRIIAGSYKGRRLKTLDGLAVRPTSDRLRETLFNVLAARIAGARFLDICAGSGAVGIEALSRGASEATFIEATRRTAELIGENLRHCGVMTGAHVVNRDVLTALKYFAAHRRQFELIYVDPPYDAGLYSPVLWLLGKHALTADDGVVIVEHRKQNPPAPAYEQLRAYRVITQGETCLTFFDRSNDGGGE